MNIAKACRSQTNWVVDKICATIDPMGVYLPHWESGGACFTFSPDSFFQNLSYGLVDHKPASPILSEYFWHV